MLEFHSEKPNKYKVYTVRINSGSSQIKTYTSKEVETNIHNKDY